MAVYADYDNGYASLVMACSGSKHKQNCYFEAKD